MTRHTEKSTQLRPDEDFARYTAHYAAQRREHDAEDVARVIARKRCAGRRGSVDGEGILNSLNADPNPNDETNCAVPWLLSSIAPHECALLVIRCGVKPQALARHVRARPVRRAAIVRFLNQFAVGPDSDADPRRTEQGERTPRRRRSDRLRR